MFGKTLRRTRINQWVVAAPEMLLLMLLLLLFFFFVFLFFFCFFLFFVGGIKGAKYDSEGANIQKFAENSWFLPFFSSDGGVKWGKSLRLAPPPPWCRHCWQWGTQPSLAHGHPQAKLRHCLSSDPFNSVVKCYSSDFFIMFKVTLYSVQLDWRGTLCCGDSQIP